MAELSAMGYGLNLNQQPHEDLFSNGVVSVGILQDQVMFVCLFVCFVLFCSSFLTGFVLF